uniref:Uncharacterized protein n=1 Tax=Mycena chlorophos TaxID=658473 RepID=A0ABQ0L869_MYCCL|nr:predicted protein [Mycena chlorophos]
MLLPPAIAAAALANYMQGLRDVVANGVATPPLHPQQATRFQNLVDAATTSENEAEQHSLASTANQRAIAANRVAYTEFRRMLRAAQAHEDDQDLVRVDAFDRAEQADRESRAASLRRKSARQKLREMAWLDGLGPCKSRRILIWTTAAKAERRRNRLRLMQLHTLHRARCDGEKAHARSMRVWRTCGEAASQCLAMHEVFKQVRQALLALDVAHGELLTEGARFSAAHVGAVHRWMNSMVQAAALVD